MATQTLTPLQKSVLQVLQSGDEISTSQIKSGLAKLGWAHVAEAEIEAALTELSAMGLIEAGSETDSKAKRLLDIEERLRDLELGNADVRAELLRERNRLMGGDPNKTDQQLLEEYYAPLVAKARGVG